MNNEVKYEFKGAPGHYEINHTISTKIFGLTTSEISAPQMGELGEWIAYVRGESDDQRIATTNLFAASPLLLSALIKAVEWIDEIAAAYNTSGFAGIYQYPDWYAEAKFAIEAALNLKTVEK